METIDQTVQRLETFIKETNPLADIAPGSVLSELVVKLAAALHNPIHNEIEQLNQVNTIEAVLNSAVDTYSPIIDKIASNYNVVRNEGKKVTGLIKVIVSINKIYSIPAGFRFVQPNLGFSYVTTQEYTVVPVEMTPTDNQLQLFTEGNLYYFILPVEAADTYEKNNTLVTDRTVFSLDPNIVLSGFVEAKAFGNFNSGQAKETDKELILRFREGLAHKSIVSPVSLEHVLKQQFPVVKNISVVGVNDIELQRGKQNIFGISTLGLADIYVRTSDYIQTKTIVVPATYLGNQRWRMHINSKIVPSRPAGFYKINAILPKEGYSGSLLIKSIEYEYESFPIHNNFINRSIDARLSKYQTCVVEFEDNEDHGPNSESRNFYVTFSYMPLIEEIQNYLLTDSVRIMCADYLVKAVIPCEVILKLVLYRKNIYEDVDIISIKRDIFSYINNLRFGEDLVFSKIVDLCFNYANVKRVDLERPMIGQILPITNTNPLIIQDVNALSIPYKPELGISPNTVEFFISYLQTDGVTDNIEIRVV